jgi:hypothetical protein
MCVAASAIADLNGGGGGAQQVRQVPVVAG